MTWLSRLSLSAKLLFIFILGVIGMMLVLNLTSGPSFKRYFNDSMRPHLHKHFKYVNQQIGNPPNIEKAKQFSEDLKVKIVIFGPNIEWASDGIVPQRRGMRFLPHNDKRNGKYESGEYRKKFVIRINNRPYHTLFITQTDSELPSPFGFIATLIAGLLSVLAMLYFVINWLFSPLKGMRKSVKIIGSGDLSHRLKVNRHDEMGDLSQAINTMADDIESMLEAKRQLLLAISHELRSPITRSKVALSLMEDGALKTSLVDDMNEMETMISELLEAERLNSRHQQLNLDTVEINSLINSVINKHYAQQPIDKHLMTEPCEMQLDDSRMQFTIKNLLGNALKYRKQGEDSITISSQKVGNTVTIKVTDTGIGIAKEHLPNLMEPFYRVDASRQRKTGGYGLGLYISKQIINAHNGQLTVESELDKGTEVTITLKSAL